MTQSENDNSSSLDNFDIGDATFTPVSSADAVYELLKTAILEGKLKTDERLREVELAKRLGVSRTPLREAFTRLLSDRLLVRTVSGVIVADAQKRLRGIREIRVALEGYATRLAVPHLTEADIEFLEHSTRLSKELPLAATTERVRNNNMFHRRIFAACGVPQLHETIEEYATFFMNEATLAALTSDQARLAIADHELLVAAIRKRDADEAEKIMRRHVMLSST